jgi:hypothetical protein
MNTDKSIGELAIELAKELTLQIPPLMEKNRSIKSVDDFLKHPKEFADQVGISAKDFMELVNSGFIRKRVLNNAMKDYLFALELKDSI